jgi:hypothetical protein
MKRYHRTFGLAIEQVEVNECRCSSSKYQQQQQKDSEGERFFEMVRPEKRSIGGCVCQYIFYGVGHFLNLLTEFIGRHTDGKRERLVERLLPNQPSAYYVYIHRVPTCILLLYVILYYVLIHYTPSTRVIHKYCTSSTYAMDDYST